MKKKKTAKAKKPGGIFKKLKEKLDFHTHELPTCSAAAEDAECAEHGKRISCKQLSVKGRKFALCTHLR